MNPTKRNPIVLFGAAALLVGAGIATLWIHHEVPQAIVNQPHRSPLPGNAAANPNGARGDSLASMGLLWERGVGGQAGETRAAIPVQAAPLRAAVKGAAGERVRLNLSERFPALSGQVIQSATHDDGTVVTQVRIDGDPQGMLTLQENQAANFFLGQLYYDQYPVAYEFRPSGSGVMATRHAISDLLCSVVNRNQDGIELAGLPPVDPVKDKIARQQEAEVKAKRQLIEESKPVIEEGKPTGGTTSPGLSVADVSTTEGNSGTKNLLFTVKLSKSDRTRTITASYTTVNGTALAGSDYTATSGTVTIAPGTTSSTIAVAILGDTVVEPNETFQLVLSNPVNAVLADGTAVGTITNDDSSNVSTVPVLNSLPGAVAVAYLDMDGQVVSGTQWANGGTITAKGISTTFTQAQMTEIWRRTVEDYSPFQINVTTEEAVYLATPANRRIRCIITPDNEWYGAAGGVAYISSFTWTGDTPCWVFSDQLANSPRYIAEACAHEIGHTLGLRHDGRVSPSEAYYAGHGSGETGWAPIMGVGYYQLLVQWSKGEYLSANNTEDDLAIITSQNGFTYRVDLQPSTPAGAPPLTVNGTSVSASGILETRDDADTFAFTTQGGTVSLATSGDATSQDLDLLIEILDAAGTVLASANPDTLTDASISASLAAGTYYVRVSGVGRGDPLADGYTDYGSLGQYTISGTVP